MTRTPRSRPHHATNAAGFRQQAFVLTRDALGPPANSARATGFWIACALLAVATYLIHTGHVDEAVELCEWVGAFYIGGETARKVAREFSPANRPVPNDPETIHDNPPPDPTNP